MTKPITIALDAMGGDFGPSVTVPAALLALKNSSALTLILVGNEQQLRDQLKQQGQRELPSRLQIHHASQSVLMDDLPSFALRNKKDSSMRVAINLVKEGRADACVSAGNTGALMATARFVLKMIPGVERPALIVPLPNTESCTYMLDLGANIDVSAEVLLEFAVMGSILCSVVENKENPRVGLLNIGAEEIKGNEVIKEAARLLNDTPLNYIGFVEGDDIYNGRVDVVVCDGFVGNVSLKTTEGVAKLIRHFLSLEFKRSFLTKLAGLIAMPVLNALKRRIDPRSYNGSSLLGLQGVVVKSHGGADAVALANAINVACIEREKNVPELIGQQLETILSARQVV
jgi:glycerol-3-phosphate acyltransferase PlsX